LKVLLLLRIETGPLFHGGVISSIITPPCEVTNTPEIFFLSEMRLEIEDAVERIKQTLNDKNLVYFDGLSFFGKILSDQDYRITCTLMVMDMKSWAKILQNRSCLFY